MTKFGTTFIQNRSELGWGNLNMAGTTGYELDEIWEQVERAMNENPEPHKDLHVTYHFNVAAGKETYSYQLKLRDGTAAVEKDGSENPDCTLILPIESFKKLLVGKLNGTAAYMTGKLKVKGNLGHALKLQNLLSQYDVKAYL